MNAQETVAALLAISWAGGGYTLDVTYHSGLYTIQFQPYGGKATPIRMLNDLPHAAHALARGLLTLWGQP